MLEYEMQLNGIPSEFFPIALIGLLQYGFLCFCIWKFYQMLGKINDNIAGVRQAIERTELRGSSASTATTPTSLTCPSCGLVNPPSAQKCDCGCSLVKPDLPKSDPA
jgi:hypothetical protein